jgi:heterodisulfide reductase subunit C
VTQTLSGTLAARIRSGSGENVYKCYQCKKCSTGCPVAQFADVHPAQIMRAVQLGDEALTVDSKFIWLCTGCQTCTTRCPQSIDIATVMDELRMIAREDGRVRKDMPFARILDLNYKSFKRWGRLYEVELISLDLLKRPKAALDYTSLGPKMMLKGKISLLPTVGDRAQMKKMAAAAERIEARKRAEAKAKAAGKAPGASGASAAGEPDPGCRCGSEAAGAGAAIGAPGDAAAEPGADATEGGGSR